jgi:hypothetical protein
MSRQSSTAILFSVIVSIGLVVVAGCVPPQEVAVIDAEAKQEEEAQQAQLQKINAAVSAAVNEVKNSIDYCRGKVTVELKDIIRVDQTRANVNAKFVAEMMALGKQYGGKTDTVGNGLRLTFDDLGQRDYMKVKKAIEKKATDATPQVMLAGDPAPLECNPVVASAKWASLSGGASVENEPKESVDLTFRLSGLLDGTSFWLVPKSNSFLVNLEQQTGASANDIFRVRHEPNNGTWAKTIRGKVTKFDPSDVYVMIARDVKIGKGKFKVVEYRVFNVRLPRGVPEDQQIKLVNALAQPACPPVAIDSASVNYFKGQLGSCK